MHDIVQMQSSPKRWKQVRIVHYTNGTHTRQATKTPHTFGTVSKDTYIHINFCSIGIMDSLEVVFMGFAIVCSFLYTLIAVKFLLLMYGVGCVIYYNVNAVK